MMIILDPSSIDHISGEYDVTRTVSRTSSGGQRLGYANARLPRYVANGAL